MIVSIEENRTTLDVFLLMESIARELLREAELIFEIDEDEMRLQFPVTLGLSAEMYQVAYPVRYLTDIHIDTPSRTIASWSVVSRTALHLDASGEFAHHVQERIASWKSFRNRRALPLMYHIQNPLDNDALFSLFYRKSVSVGADFRISDRKINCKLRRFSTSSLLSTVGEPVDIVATKGDEWALYHVDGQNYFATSYWFFEAHELLDQILSHKGGMTNG